MLHNPLKRDRTRRGDKPVMAKADLLIQQIMSVVKRELCFAGVVKPGLDEHLEDAIRRVVLELTAPSSIGGGRNMHKQRKVANE